MVSSHHHMGRHYRSSYSNVRARVWLSRSDLEHKLPKEKRPNDKRERNAEQEKYQVPIHDRCPFAVHSN
jgi:hypothetical protein